MSYELRAFMIVILCTFSNWKRRYIVFSAIFGVIIMYFCCFSLLWHPKKGYLFCDFVRFFAFFAFSSRFLCDSLWFLCDSLRFFVISLWFFVIFCVFGVFLPRRKEVYEDFLFDKITGWKMMKIEDKSKRFCHSALICECGAGGFCYWDRFAALFYKAFWSV